MMVTSSQNSKSVSKPRRDDEGTPDALTKAFALPKKPPQKPKLQSHHAVFVPA